MSEKQLTVGELIVLLEAFPKELPVKTEGCDCWGDAGGAEILDFKECGEHKQQLLITRTGATR